MGAVLDVYAPKLDYDEWVYNGQPGGEGFKELRKQLREIPRAFEPLFGAERRRSHRRLPPSRRHWERAEILEKLFPGAERGEARGHWYQSILDLYPHHLHGEHLEDFVIESLQSILCRDPKSRPSKIYADLKAMLC